MIQKKRKRFAALDAVLVLSIIALAAAVCVRIVIGEEGLFPEDVMIEGTYAVTLSPWDSNGGRFEESFKVGEDVYLSSGEVMGKISSFDKSSAEVSVSGVMTDSGFLMNGTFYLAPNMELELRSADETVTVTVTDITFIE